MAIRFRFFSSKAFDNVPVSGDYMSLLELKDAIAERVSPGILRGKGHVKEAFDFSIYDADSGEEIVGSNCKVYKYSCVLVKRVPAYVLSQQRAVARENRGEEIEERSKPVAGFDDDFGEVYSSPISDQIRCSSWDTATSCVTGADSRVNLAANKTARESVGRFRRGGFQSAKMPGTKLQTVKAPCKVDIRTEPFKMPCSMEIPPELLCSLCFSVMKDPVLIRCCCSSFCSNCIKAVLADQRKCPNCESTKCTGSDLLPNRHLFSMIQLFQKYDVSASSRSGSNGSSISVQSNNVNTHPISTPFNAKVYAHTPQQTLDSNCVRQKLPCASSSSSKLTDPKADSLAVSGSSQCLERKPLLITLSGAKRLKT